jgi:hypothetical protein
MILKDKFNEALDLDRDNYIIFECVEIADKLAIDFHQWMRLNDTRENAEKYFHYTDKDMLNAFKKEKGL